MGKIYFKSVQYSGGFGDSYVYPILRSTDEREVGTWTDGKPLYEKSYEGTISSTQQTIEDFGQTTITMVSGVGMVAKTTGSQMAIGMLPSATNWQSGLHVAANALKLFTTNEVNGGTYRITIRYTKDGDPAGSGRWTSQRVPTVHYSTAEQVVGTWVDGSTIYEKTYELSSELQISNTTWTSTAITQTGIGKILGVEIFGESNYQGSGLANMSSNTIQLQTTRNSTAYCKYFTMRYTKAST